jgi:hypothetical protein
MLIKYVYVVFMGLLLACFVGFGIAAFYKAPKMPEYPASYNYSTDASPSAQAVMEKKRYDDEFEVYRKAESEYSKYVSAIAIVASIIMLVISLTLFRSILIIADGLLLGGVLTLAYGIMRGFSSEDDTFRFVVVSVGLLITLTLGYVKFVKPDIKPSKKK